MTNEPINETPDRIAGAALLALLVVSAVMLLALVTKTPPHPPLATPIFALGPFIGASLAVGGAALFLSLTGNPAWRYAAILFAVTILPSFGPQKFLVPEFPEIWPAVILAQISLVTLVVRLVSSFRTSRWATAQAEGKPIR
ncbi:hypothetical protein [Nisaea sp.]|uniref:hypothetical protein n=1 Tax=Nisaea sp. TaxID=2024842 RepID=UPI002B26AB26|nr:hypothetical protein [Nisaea sp.]